MENYYTPAKISVMLEGGIPSIAWPTVILILACVATQIGIMILFHYGAVDSNFTAIVNTIAAFAAFTPMHDAAHGSVAKGQFRIINNFVGYLSSFCFPVPFQAFKHIHLLHHKHTNEPGDPDIYAGSGPTVLLPLRWMTIEIKYYITYLPKLHTRPASEAFSAVTQLVVMIVVLVWLFQSGYGNTVLYGWVLPGRFSAMILAYAFDYLPHRPHKVSRYRDMYEATAVTSLYGQQTWLLTWPLLHQNYHNIHHLAPYVPFYLYSVIWHKTKKDLIKKGTKIKPLIPIP